MSRTSDRIAPAIPVDPEREVPEADAEAVARKILLDQLTGRARTRHELAQRLAAKNVPEHIATRLLDRFEQVGLIDDAGFAREWVTTRQSGRALAAPALMQELRRKGVADEVARAALEEVGREGEQDSARALVRRRAASMARLAPEVRMRRLVGLLARKGHSPGAAFGIVREVLDELDPS